MQPVIRAFQILRKPDKAKFAALVLMRVLAQSLDLIGLALVGVIGVTLAAGLNGGRETQFLGFNFQMLSSEQVFWLIVMTVSLFLGKSAVASLLLRVTTRFLARVEAETATEVTNYLFSGGLGRLRMVPEGERLWLGLQSTHIGFSVMLFAGANIVTEAALFLVVLLTFLAVDVATTAIIAAYFAFVVITFQLAVSRRLKRLGAELAESSIATNNSILSISGAFREIIAGSALSYYLGVFRLSRSRYAYAASLQRYVMGLPRFLIEAALMVGFLALVLWQFVQGDLAEGMAVTAVFLAGGVRLMAAMLPLQNALSEVRIKGAEAMKALDIVSQLREPKAEDFGEPGFQMESNRSRPVSVQFQKVSFAFEGTSSKAISELTLTIDPGTFAAIVGPSGAGKTTAADVLLGLHQPDSGLVLIDGYSPLEYRGFFPGGMAYVPQRPGIVQGNLRQNVALGHDDSSIDNDRVEKVIHLANLDELVRSLPHGLDTDLGMGKLALSGGQVQRLGIARALYSEPKLLVLDEATSALDAEAEDYVTSMIRSLAGSVTVVVVAHRLSTIQHADKVFVMEGGLLTAEGSFQQVRRRVPLIERYVQLMNLNSQPPLESI